MVKVVMKMTISDILDFEEERQKKILHENLQNIIFLCRKKFEVVLGDIHVNISKMKITNIPIFTIFIFDKKYKNIITITIKLAKIKENTIWFGISYGNQIFQCDVEDEDYLKLTNFCQKIYMTIKVSEFSLQGINEATIEDFEFSGTIGKDENEIAFMETGENGDILFKIHEDYEDILKLIFYQLIMY